MAIQNDLKSSPYFPLNSWKESVGNAVHFGTTTAVSKIKRYFIEKSFREAKKELELNEYQTRSEERCNKHMAISMLALLFLMKKKYITMHNRNFG